MAVSFPYNKKDLFPVSLMYIFLLLQGNQLSWVLTFLTKTCLICSLGTSGIKRFVCKGSCLYFRRMTPYGEFNNLLWNSESCAQSALQYFRNVLCCKSLVCSKKTNCKLFVLIGYFTINDSWNTVFQVITISEFDSNINRIFFEI